jgi:hypothetical protein
MTNHNQAPERLGGNRQERRHPDLEKAQAAPPAGNAHDIHIHLQTSDRGPMIAISSFAAHVLLQLANSTAIQGSTLKMQLSLAQLEIEEGLKNPLPKVEVAAPDSVAEQPTG